MTIDRDNTRALITDTRTWIRLHRENKFQAEAAKRMARLADALESALSAVPVEGEQERKVRDAVADLAEAAGLEQADVAEELLEFSRAIEEYEAAELRVAVADALREKIRREPNPEMVEHLAGAVLKWVYAMRSSQIPVEGDREALHERIADTLRRNDSCNCCRPSSHPDEETVTKLEQIRQAAEAAKVSVHGRLGFVDDVRRILRPVPTDGEGEAE